MEKKWSKVLRFATHYFCISKLAEYRKRNRRATSFGAS